MNLTVVSWNEMGGEREVKSPFVCFLESKNELMSIICCS